MHMEDELYEAIVERLIEDETTVDPACRGNAALVEQLDAPLAAAPAMQRRPEKDAAWIRGPSEVDRGPDSEGAGRRLRCRSSRTRA